MKYQPPHPVVLTEDEQRSLDRINFNIGHLPHEEAREILFTAAELFTSLLARKAIPETRLDYFTDPKLNVSGRGKSRKQIFEQNGTSGSAIFRHGNFLPYIEYFVYGPKLPPRSIAGFCKLLNDDVGTSGMMLNSIQAFVRAEVRANHLDPGEAGDEFFKLAYEIGLDVDRCALARNAARTTR